MRCLITGGAGFIGSHLTEKLLAEGSGVVVYDNLATGRRENLKAVWGHPRLEFIEGSVMDPVRLESAIANCDEVYHLAAVLGVKLILQKPLDSMLVNLRGTENVLGLAARHGCKVLVASTSEVYGKHTGTILKETDDRIYGPVTKSRWAYAGAKAMDEFLALAYRAETELPVVVVRLFNTVGPRQTGYYGMVLPSFVQQALSGTPITVYGTGEQTRSFTYVGDAVDALVSLLREPLAYGEIFNVGSGHVTSILQLAEKVKSISGSASHIQLVPYEEAYSSGFEDMLERTPDIAKIQALIGFEPRVGIDDIIRQVVDHFRTHEPHHYANLT